MKVRILFLQAALMTAATICGASAQSVITLGSGMARDCYLHAKAATQVRDGVEVCNQALERDVLTKKDRAGTHDNRGVLLDLLGFSEKAAEDFNTAIALDPTLGDPYVNLGSMLIKKGQYQAALDQINKGMDLGLGFPHIGYYDRAIAEQMLGRYKEAYYDYKKVLELEPRFTMASERLKDFVVTRIPARTPS